MKGKQIPDHHFKGFCVKKGEMTPGLLPKSALSGFGKESEASVFTQRCFELFWVKKGVSVQVPVEKTKMLPPATG